MTATVTATTAPSTRSAPMHAGRARSFRWSWRLIRRGTLLMWLTVAAYMALEIYAYRHTYPDAESRKRILELSNTTAVRMMQGIPGKVDTAGGFAIWDGGWMVMLILATWSLLTITRLTRAEEDSGRAELVLVRPLTPRQVLAGHLAALGTALVGIAASASLVFIALGEPVAGAVLWAVGVAGFGAVVTSVGAVCAQLIEPRRRVAALGMALIATMFLLRVVANSKDSRAWVLNLTPFGWPDKLHAFAANTWPWLAAPLLTAAALSALAIALCGLRDTGAAVWRARESRSSRLHLLRNAPAFSWRLTSGVLLTWIVTLVVVTLVYGLMVGALADFITKDASYRRLLESMGVDMSVPIIGFLSYIVRFLALPIATFVGWRMGSIRQEEAEGRLDNLLVRGVQRWRWLAEVVLQAFAAAILLVIACGIALWAGTSLANVQVTAGDVFEPMVGTLPLILLFLGLATLTYGLTPRLTSIVPVTLAVLGYLLNAFGELLNWPGWVVAMSPFDHLAQLPGQPVTMTEALAMTGIGLACALAGIVAFTRRDLRGA